MADRLNVITRPDRPAASRGPLAVAVAVFGVVCLFPAGAARAQEGRLFGLRNVSNLTLPLGEAADRPTAFFRCGAVTTEKRRLGILQLGLHPHWVFREVEIRLTGQGAESQGLADVAALFAEEPFLRAGKIDGLVVRHAGSGVVVAARTADYARSGAEDYLLLREVKLERPVEAPVPAELGRLFLTGPRAGQLSLGQNSQLTIDLAK